MKSLVMELDNNLSITSETSNSGTGQTIANKKLHPESILLSIEVQRDSLTFSYDNAIGQGSFSTVFKGRLLGMDVAIKSFKETSGNSISKVRERFEREGNLMMRLRHPHIAQVLAACTSNNDENGSPLLIFEYLEGGSLSHYIHSVTKSPLDHATLFSVARDVALALNYLHNKNIAHLDVKSANVLLDAYLRAKLADLGLAKEIDQDAEIKINNGNFELRGTPAFMAPEMLTGKGFSKAVDVYGYGMILWEMASGSKPFHGFQLSEVIDLSLQTVKTRCEIIW